jgi:hypothetical protein
MRVGVVVVEVIDHRLGDGARDLRAAGAVEVGDRLIVVFAVERGEVRPDLSDARD